VIAKSDFSIATSPQVLKKAPERTELATMEAAGQQLLDFNQTFEVSLLDKVVEAFYDPRNVQVSSWSVLCRPLLTT
jgi:hypothetical protein